MKKDSFKKKLAAYIVMSEAFLLAHPVDADAQIMYTDVNPDLVIHNSFFNLDLNNDGVVDYKLQHQEFQENGYYFSNFVYNENIFCLNGNKGVGLYTSSSFLYALNSGDTINQNKIFNIGNYLQAHQGFQNSISSNSWNGGHFLGVDKYAGLKINVSGNTYYGWARLDVNDHEIVLKDYAINLSPDSSILAGESSGCSVNSYNIVPNGNQFICEGDSIPVNVLNTMGLHVQWLNHGNWINGETDTSLFVIQPGSYSALVSDSNCTIIITEVNFDSVYMTIDTSHQDESNQNSDGSINVTVYGNSSSYIYQWSNGATTQDLNNIPAGTYELIVTSTTCLVSDTIQVVVNNYIDDSSPFLKGSENNFSFTFTVDNQNLLFHLTDNSLMSNQIDILNGLGQLVATVTVTNQTPEADLSALPAGIYFYHIRSKQKTYSGKFFIE